MILNFTKMEGCGNDYIYVDARDVQADWPALSRAMSDRHFGIGSDGLILIMESEMADLKMRMFNADGSEGEMCGNGIRCFTKYAIERDIVRPSNGLLTVETLGGTRTVAPTRQNGVITRARVAMGTPELQPQEVPVDVWLSGETDFEIVIPESMGAVVRVDIDPRMFFPDVDRTDNTWRGDL